jgi:ribosomal protein S18 acetylase RimI-like enzyme
VQNSRVFRLLDNIMWNCLSGPHARYSVGTESTRRYARGFSPIAACADPQRPDFAVLDALFDPGESFYIDIWTGNAPAGWILEREARMVKMVWQGTPPRDDPAPDAVRLLPEHYGAALELATLTNPGPFGIRTPELGEYFGYFEDGRLIAMAGERLCAGNLQEISGVCTHPDYQGRGQASRLTLKLVHRQLSRGLIPFLHVVSHNTGARALYSRLGFRDHRETALRVLSKV